MTLSLGSAYGRLMQARMVWVGSSRIPKWFSTTPQSRATTLAQMAEKGYDEVRSQGSCERRRL